MEAISFFWNSFFGWMPPVLFVIVLAFVAIAVVVFILKLVAFVWDILPFA